MHMCKRVLKGLEKQNWMGGYKVEQKVATQPEGQAALTKKCKVQHV